MVYSECLDLNGVPPGHCVIRMNHERERPCFTGLHIDETEFVPILAAAANTAGYQAVSRPCLNAYLGRARSVIAKRNGPLLIVVPLNPHRLDEEAEIKCISRRPIIRKRRRLN